MFTRYLGHPVGNTVPDLKEHRTGFVTEGKDVVTTEKFIKTQEAKSSKKENIELVSMDMSPAFIRGVKNNLPDGQFLDTAQERIRAGKEGFSVASRKRDAKRRQ